MDVQPVPAHPAADGFAAIEPVSGSAARPRWSVMIPTFNCAQYLRRTLESVLAQDPGPERMQIEVVDDCSTLDDPRAVVEEVGRGRVAFHRHEANSGSATHNFNHCLRRSRGGLVHILHGDDWVLPGFYDEIGRLADRYPDAALLAARSVFVDEDGHWKDLTRLLPKLDEVTRDASDFLLRTELQCAGVVVRREFYERHGGFRTDLVHAADHEMWHRAIHRGGGVVSPLVLGVYRVFAGNDTGRLMRSAENLRDRLRLARIFERENPTFPMDKARAILIRDARRQWWRFRKNGDAGAAAANARFLAEFGGLRERWRIFWKTAGGR